MHMARYIRLFHNLGYNVLAPDDRASGRSQGKYITFGWPDRLDYVKWIKQVIAKKGSDSQIGLFGVSMGGATVMMVSGERLPKQVKAIVEDCGYSSIESELSEQLKQQFNLPKEPMITAARIMGTIRVGYDFGKGSSTKQLEKNKLPIFFIHGDSDTFVPTKMVYENYKATSAPKKLWVTKNTSTQAWPCALSGPLFLRSYSASTSTWKNAGSGSQRERNTLRKENCGNMRICCITESQRKKPG